MFSIYLVATATATVGGVIKHSAVLLPWAVVSSAKLDKWDVIIITTVKPVYNSHPWDNAKWLLYRGGLLIEVGGVLGLY